MCLTDAAAVEDVLFGDNGVCKEEQPSVVDFTSMNPFQSLKIAERMQRVGAQAYVDAPVSGGVSGAENGTLVVMCGGVPDQIARFEPGDHRAHRRIDLLEVLPVAAGVVPMAKHGVEVHQVGEDQPRPSRLQGAQGGLHPVEVIVCVDRLGDPPPGEQVVDLSDRHDRVSGALYGVEHGRGRRGHLHGQRRSRFHPAQAG